MNILIVDDNKRIRTAIKSILESPGIEFSECSDGSEALDLYREVKPSWVLMDVKMPRINGFIAAKNIIAEFPHARVVFVTDYDDKELRSTAKQIGATGYILKEELIKLKDLCIGNLT